MPRPLFVRLGCLELEIRETPAVAPAPLLIYYGYPSLINGANSNITTAANTFSAYSHVVLGGGLELPNHPDHNNTVAIMNHGSTTNTKFFGYIDLGVTNGTFNYPLSEIYQRVDAWNASGADGIFFDDFGYDFGVTRARQNAAVSYVHQANLPVVANGFFIDQVFGNTQNTTYNPMSTPTALTASDYYLYESYQITENNFVSGTTWRAKADALAAVRTTLPINVLSVTTTVSEEFPQAKFDYAYWSAAMDGHVAFGWGEKNFSASSANAPFRTRPNTNLGNSLTGSIDGTLPLLTRNTDTLRISVDTRSQRAGANLLDFGDAPASYGTLLVDNGARHIVGGPRLGATVDTEDDAFAYIEGMPNGVFGRGDNVYNEDEDGITIPAFFQTGIDAVIVAKVQDAPTGAKIDGWIDFNQDGDFTDLGERVLSGVSVTNGNANLTISVPANATPGKTFMRTRISTLGTATPTGLAPDGEVEDNAIIINLSSEAALKTIRQTILDHRLPTGVLRTAIDPSFYQQTSLTPHYILEPYFTSFAVQALLAAPSFAGQLSKFEIAHNHLNFWLDRRKPIVLDDVTYTTIPRVVVNASGALLTETINDVNGNPIQPTYGADADDSALSMMLIVAADLYTSGGPTTILTSRQADFAQIAATLEKIIGTDGLPRPFVDPTNPYDIKQTLDCLEVHEALVKYSHLLRDFYQDPVNAARYANVAATLATAIETHLFDTTTQLYRQYKEADSPNLNTWYPIAYVQAWPIITGYLSANSAKSRTLLNSIYSVWDGSPKEQWTTRTDAGFLAWAALRAGDTTLAANAVQTILPWALQNRLPSLDPSDPLQLTAQTVSDYGFLLRALLPSLTGSGTGTFTENASPLPIVPSIIVSDVDNRPFSTATITLSNYVANQDLLAFLNNSSTMGNIAIQSNSGDVLTLVSVGVTASPAQWQAALRAVTYVNTSEDPNTISRTFRIAITDDVVTSNVLQAQVNVTAVNDPPVAIANTVTTNEDTARSFALADFPFSDAEGNPLTSITIASLSLAAGDSLRLGSTNVVAGDVITAAQIPNLVYTPAANANGNNRSSFTFRVNDASSGVINATLTINVTAINDPPVAIANTLTTNEDTPRSFVLADFPFNDIESNPLTSITIGTVSLASGDTLKLGSTDVASGDVITAAQIPNLVYTPAANANGNNRSSFTLHVNDASSGVINATLTINVVAVNDPPEAIANNVTTNEDTAWSFVLADFPFSDVENNPLTSITIGTLSLALGDSLKLGSTDVNSGNVITAAQIPNLVYTPAANANGNNRSSFTFSVNDASSGVSIATLTMNVTAVDDPPTLDPISDPAGIVIDSGEQQITLTGISAGGAEIQPLSITVVSTNTSLIPHPTINYTSPATTGTLTFTPVSGQIGSANVIVTVTAGSLSISRQFTVVVNPINQRPVLDSTISRSLNPVAVNNPAPLGTLIADFARDGVTDADGDELGGIAVINANATWGDWEYSLDSGATWLPLSPVNPSAARKLRPTDMIRVVPRIASSTVLELEFRAWDQTVGVAGETVNLTNLATDHSVSLNADTASIRISNVFATITEDQRSRGHVLKTLSTSIRDQDSNSKTGMAIVGLGGEVAGRWEYYMGTWKPLPQVSSQTALLLRSTDLVRFIPAADQSGDAYLLYHAWDQTFGSVGTTVNLTIIGVGGRTAFSEEKDALFIRVTPVNDRPVLDTASTTPLTVNSIATTANGVSVAAILGSSATDADKGTIPGLAVTLAARVGGYWQFSTSAGNWSDFSVVSATIPLLLNPDHRIRFVPNSTFNGSVRFAYKAWDRTEGVAGFLNRLSRTTALSTATKTITRLNQFSEPPNTAPTLNSGLNVVFPAVVEDQPTQGNPIQALLGGVTDVDSGSPGIAITGLTGTNAGVWQYSFDRRTWRTIPAVTPERALLLKNTSHLRYVPLKDSTASASITYRAWDQSRGTAGQLANTTLPNVAGGSGSFSIDSETATVQVIPMNDAPVLNIAPIIRFTTIAINNSSSQGDLVGTLLGSNLTDVDAGALRGIAVTNAYNGTRGGWDYQLAESPSMWKRIEASASFPLLLRDIDRIRFSTFNSFTGSMTLNYRGWDQTDGTAGQRRSVTQNTSLSRATEVAKILVRNANTRPVIDTRPDLRLAANAADPIGVEIAALLGGLADPDAGALRGVAIIFADNRNGYWEYQIANENWNEISGASPSRAYLLSATDRIRFVPNWWFDSGPTKIQFKAWDQTDSRPIGSEWSTFTSDAYSRETETATLWVNRAPSIWL